MTCSYSPASYCPLHCPSLLCASLPFESSHSDVLLWSVNSHRPSRLRVPSHPLETILSRGPTVHRPSARSTVRHFSVVLSPSSKRAYVSGLPLPPAVVSTSASRCRLVYRWARSRSVRSLFDPCSIPVVRTLPSQDRSSGCKSYARLMQILCNPMHNLCKMHYWLLVTAFLAHLCRIPPIDTLYNKILIKTIYCSK